MDYKTIVEANKLINTTEIKGKDYAEVNQRIKAFRFLYPEGTIFTEMLSDTGDKCVFRATVSNGEGKILGTGTAFEFKDASFINKTSYIENCETSAVGRALAMVGLGVDTSIASYEEVANAIENQKKKEDPMQPLPVEKEQKPKKAAAQKTEKKEETSKKPEECGYPTRDEMLADAKKFYEQADKAKDLSDLYKHWKVESLESLTDAQLMTLYRMHHR